MSKVGSSGASQSGTPTEGECAGDSTHLERLFKTHREKFALKRKRDLQKKRALEQYGPDGPGKGPPDPEPPTGQRMAVNE